MWGPDAPIELRREFSESLTIIVTQACGMCSWHEIFDGLIVESFMTRRLAFCFQLQDDAFPVDAGYVVFGDHAEVDFC